MQSISRRRILKLSLGAAGASALVWAARSASDAGVSPAGLQTYSRTSWALGTDVSLTVLHENKEIAEAALHSAFVTLNQVEDVLSIYRPNSEISRFNKTGRLDLMHTHFRKVLEASQSMALASNGAFDATVQPLWELYFEAQKKKTLPNDAALKRARDKVDFRKIIISGSNAHFALPGMGITFNGIAQGYAADCVLATLRANGIEHALVDTGELVSKGSKGNGEAFKTGIQHPRKPDEFLGICSMDGRALATSGDYATYFSDDFLYHHIFDPATGRSPTELASVSIMAPTGMLADALTKPVFILGSVRGMEFVESMPGCDAYIVTKDGHTSKTKGFPLV